jgi:hypothetical protein
MKKLFLLLVSSALFVAMACGSDDPAAGPTSTPTPAAVPPTATPTPGGIPVTPTAVPVGYEEQPRLDEARDRWDLHEPVFYEFDFQWLCFCGPDYTTPVRISVKDGAIVSLKDPLSGEEVTPTDPSIFKTIDGLLGWVQAEIDRPADALTVDYERDFGYPLNASSDRILNAIDDEMAFRVSNFRVNPQDLDIETLRAELDAAQSRWFDAGYQSYTFATWWECFCPAEYSTKVKIEVRAGEVMSVTNAETGQPHTVPGDTPYRTVDGLFGWIYKQLNRDPEFAALEFDPVTGFPAKAQFDPIVGLWDDEQAFFAEDLEKLDVHTETQAALNDAKAKWAEAGLADYDFEFNWSCFCTPEFTARVVVSVRDGAVTSVKKADGGADIATDLFDSFVTVDGLFDRIQSAIDEDAARITVEFDADTGLPVSGFIDHNFMIADEETGWSAGSLAPVAS